jgi:hypothetical protein
MSPNDRGVEAAPEVEPPARRPEAVEIADLLQLLSESDFGAGFLRCDTGAFA